MISKANGDPDAMFNVATQYLQGAAGEVDLQKALTPGKCPEKKLRGRAERFDGIHGEIFGKHMKYLWLTVI